MSGTVLPMPKRVFSVSKPPQAEARPSTIKIHGKQLVDEYAWLREKTPDVLEHLAAENTYTDATLKKTKTLREELYKEIRGRITENDMSVPVIDGPYEYYARVKKGKQYALHCRKDVRGKEELLLDENVLAKGEKYFSLNCYEVSPDHTLLAYTCDVSGNEDATLYIKDLRTGRLLSDTIPSVGDVVWSEDGSYIFYTKEQHPHPPRIVMRHKVGEAHEKDVVLYEEKDVQWYVSLGKTRSRKYIIILAGNYNTTEARVLSADNPLAEPILIAPRSPKIKYYLDHHEEYFYIMTNEKAVNFKIMRTSTEKPQKRFWKTWLPHKLERSITGIQPYANYLVLTWRENGSEEIFITDPELRKLKKIVLPEDVHDISLSGDLEYNSPYIRIAYQSFVTPRTVYDYDIFKNTLSTRKQQKVPRYSPSNFTSKRIWAKSGKVRIPIVLVHKKGLKMPAPLLLEAYGSYGITHDAHFSIAKLSLLERGWVIAIAQPRGGGEMGWKWHKDAHLMTKHRTSDDFIACAEHLVNAKYTRRDLLAITGGSAGGMLMGQVMNLRPDIAKAALVYVPAADLLTSLLDETLGGTRLHYDEIGNPSIKKQFEYILKTSPYENVRSVEYPTTLVRASLNDIRTPYWEAAKWVARLRAKGKGGPILFKCEMAAGHFGKSGRYNGIRERAYDFAFLLETVQK